jgi:hypothetical protein
MIYCIQKQQVIWEIEHINNAYTAPVVSEHPCHFLFFGLVTGQLQRFNFMFKSLSSENFSTKSEK